ncbi:hypothetical protein N0V90_002272 [Kalmusia sp. IMI 367209]|nr:hypothetical protein N0V90_002272 [Kalmusia sp. IMI 367209]
MNTSSSPIICPTTIPVANAPPSPIPALSASLWLQQPGKPAAPKATNLKIPDDGYKSGNVTVFNNCPYFVNLRSVGGRYLNGSRNATTGWEAVEDKIPVLISPGENFTEPFRTSGGCNYTGAPPYCPDEDKLAGQGISMKIAKGYSVDNSIMQFEYTLYQNPRIIPLKTFKKLIYDVSLLDCGQPMVNGTLANGTKGLVPAIVTDFNATTAMHDQKVRECPGYDGGVAVTFSTDEKGYNCPPIYCDGKSKSFMIYTWDKSRDKESTFTCEREYHGNMRLDLCATRGDTDTTYFKLSVAHVTDFCSKTKLADVSGSYGDWVYGLKKEGVQEAYYS